MKLTDWRAPALDCTSLKAVLERTENQKTLVFNNTVTSVTLGEPDPALFSIPSEYREVAPSEMDAEMTKGLGVTIRPNAAAELKRRDDIYTGAKSK